MQDSRKNSVRQIIGSLFLDAAAVSVRPLPGGRSGAIVLAANPTYDVGQGSERVVKMGPRKYIEREVDNYRRYVAPFAGFKCTVIEESTFHGEFGGFKCSFVGGNLGTIRSFGSFYRSAKPAEVAAVVRNLFKETCRTWYVNRRASARVDTDLWKEVVSRLNLRFQTIGDLLPTLDGENAPLVDAMLNWCNKPPFRRHVHECITHGDLNMNNILVDNNHGVWLIDYYNTGPSHIMRDFARLEATIKFEILPEVLSVRNMGLDKVVNSDSSFEACLTAHETFDSFLSTEPSFGNPELSKAMEAIRAVRECAQSSSDSEDLTDYYVCLFLQTLKFLTWSGISDAVTSYVCRSADRIRQRLS